MRFRLEHPLHDTYSTLRPRRGEERLNCHKLNDLQKTIRNAKIKETIVRKGLEVTLYTLDRLKQVYKDRETWV